MEVSRRAFMTTTAVGALALAGCAGQTPSGQVPVWLAALQAVATEVYQIVPQLVAVGLTSTAVAKLQGIIAQVESVIATLNAASTGLQGASVLAQVEGYINAIAPLVAPYVGLVPGGSIIGLIIASLPAIEAALNFIVSLLTPQAQALAVTAPPVNAAVAHSMARNLKVRDAMTPAEEYLLMLLAQAAQNRSHRHKRG